LIVTDNPFSAVSRKSANAKISTQNEKKKSLLEWIACSRQPLAESFERCQISALCLMAKFLFALCFSDIVIAQSQTPKDVDVLAKEIGLLPAEVDLYGKKKAKVSLQVLNRLSGQKDGRYVVVTG
jgi:hypothetical protein